ncbi:Streptothricin hydrolase [Stutzerimonas frequens]|jgi:nicotinamidase-related amidase|uniref:cysteine hydrolase family protein n=1 Tax=Stutzerimonas stutzeri group TaxID=136846 RepID=UPI001268AB0C|nr:MULTISPECIES: cysteine hydrolase family protein [Stutzerimonas stutzeri group]MDA0427303.1 cysteine hydrolase family protein [Stutzerimonas frequens]QFU14453.1 Streptothricin hydrolase [Stutzerimonas frequens]QTF56878.1 cysteine hydrolase [Stutzerimonas frequens]|tara:strand:+ start:8901 stop:9452 length:552 start_codon:yes stop_codon:yes gene_type:complete
MGKRALVLVDIQNDYFPGGKWTLHGIEAAADNAARVLEAARAAGDLVVHVRHEFASADAPFFTTGSEGARIHPKVAVREGEAVILKHQVNSFRDTELEALLRGRSIEQLTIVGNMSHLCIDAITRASADLGFSATVIHDACASRDLEFDGTQVPAAQVHAAIMASLAFAYAKVQSTEAYLAEH